MQLHASSSKEGDEEGHFGTPEPSLDPLAEHIRQNVVSSLRPKKDLTLGLRPCFTCLALSVSVPEHGCPTIRIQWVACDWYPTSE